jgi:exonuclease III
MLCAYKKLKATEDQIPVDAITKQVILSILLSSQKGYSGVAILSKIKP